ncbi:MAG: glycosyltransferase family 2 protein [Clostridia bacterium]|nr:glycosyltransferase family 2 protein [Clostridia bacterium]
MKEKILLFIPAYNCEKQIIRVLNQLDEKVFNYINEVIVINNRSTDNTEKVIKKYINEHKEKNIKLLRNKENYGLGGSHKVAFDYAKKNKYEYIIILHGDDQGRIKDIIPFIENEEYKKHDCLLGARFMKGSQLKGYSKFRTFGNRVYNILFSIVVRKRIYDLGAGLNLYSIRMLEDEFYKKFPDNLMFNYCMILASNYYNHKIEFVPISWREDDQVSNVKMVNQAITVLKMLFKYFINKKFIIKEMREKIIDEYIAEEIN